jgi:hypothetical protein
LGITVTFPLSGNEQIGFVALAPMLHGEVPVEATQEGVEAELSVAPALLAQLDWRGRVLTGDALYAQRHRCQQLITAGGD